jgi:FMN phosphatase YigB (HAD superfamily)
MQKGIILFDIDRTIFDTNTFSKVLGQELRKVINKVSIEDVQKAKHEFVSSLSADREFDPENFITFLCKKFNLNDRKSLIDVFYSSEYKHWFTDFIFPETFEIFTKLKDNFRLGIYSEGTKKFQNYKFNSMNISSYLDKDLIFILDHKTNPEAISKIPKDSVVIDDKENVCEYLTQNNIKTIWLNKKDKKINLNFETIHNLSDLPNCKLLINN